MKTVIDFIATDGTYSPHSRFILKMEKIIHILKFAFVYFTSSHAPPPLN